MVAWCDWKVIIYSATRHTGYMTIAEVENEKSRKRRRSSNRRRAPLCFRILVQVYERYGLKHVVLLFILLLYTFLGSFIFLVIEEPHERELKRRWEQALRHNRSDFVDNLIPQLFNNSRYLVFITANVARRMEDHLQISLSQYEHQIGLHQTDSFEWNYLNAILFSSSLFTTIGYGYIHAKTAAGRVLTMIYALFGIPLVLLVLSDLGKLLTVGLKFPWFQTKRLFRRIFRLCTRKPLSEILAIEQHERDTLAVFDLPIPVAIGLVVGWIFLCSATFCMWEDWGYFKAFYFFFVSLSTIGLGDIKPEQPKYLFLMLPYIIIGLSLVSMCVNVIQTRFEKTYNVDSHLETYENAYEQAAEDIMRQLADEKDVDDPTRTAVMQRVSSMRRSTRRGVRKPRAVLGIFQDSTFSLASVQRAVINANSSPKGSPRRVVLNDHRSIRNGLRHMSCDSLFGHKSTQTTISYPARRMATLSSSGVSVENSTQDLPAQYAEPQSLWTLEHTSVVLPSPDSVDTLLRVSYPLSTSLSAIGEDWEGDEQDDSEDTALLVETSKLSYGSIL